MSFRKHPWESKNKDKALAAINSLTDQEVLLKAAKTAIDTDVRTAAALKVIGQTASIDILKKYTLDTEVAVAVVRELQDMNMVISIAKSDTWEVSDEARSAAIGRIDSQVVLADIAKCSSRLSAEEAIKRIAEEELILDVATKGVYREYALEKVQDDTVLERIARNDENSSVRARAVKKLNDHHVLIEVASNDNDGLVRCNALERLAFLGAIPVFVDLTTDPSFLEKNDTFLEDVLSRDAAHNQTAIANMAILTTEVGMYTRMVRRLVAIDELNRVINELRPKRSGGVSLDYERPDDAGDHWEIALFTDDARRIAEEHLENLKLKNL